MTEAGYQLKQVFEAIQRERMVDLPMVNPALSVAVVGFEKTDCGCLGVLLTPWCMNLLLLPEADEWSALKPGSKQLHVLPSGEYEFVVADEVGIGRYQSCSLFSPMFEFPDQQAALATAEAALVVVMNEAQLDSSATTGPSVAESNLVEPVQQPMSRRDFLRGSRFR